MDPEKCTLSSFLRINAVGKGPRLRTVSSVGRLLREFFISESHHGPDISPLEFLRRVVAHLTTPLNLEVFRLEVGAKLSDFCCW